MALYDTRMDSDPALILAEYLNKPDLTSELPQWPQAQAGLGLRLGAGVTVGVRPGPLLGRSLEL
jgi:hypothetical protein